MRHNLPFLPDFRLFQTKSAKNMRKEQSNPKINVIFGLARHKYPYHYPFLCFSLSEKKILAPGEQCTHIVSNMWPENSELVLLGNLFHWLKTPMIRGCWYNISIPWMAEFSGWWIVPRLVTHMKLFHTCSAEISPLVLSLQTEILLLIVRNLE